MALVRAWELLGAEKEPASIDAEGRVRAKVTCAAHLPGGEVRIVTARLRLTEDQLKAWVTAMSGRTVEA